MGDYKIGKWSPRKYHLFADKIGVSPTKYSPRFEKTMQNE